MVFDGVRGYCMFCIVLSVLVIISQSQSVLVSISQYQSVSVSPGLRLSQMDSGGLFQLILITIEWFKTAKSYKWIGRTDGLVGWMVSGWTWV